MPIYEFACDPCRTLYQTRLGLNDPRPESCPTCNEQLRRVFSAPLLNTSNFSSPTAARYSRMSDNEEISREGEMQKIYQTVWMPAAVKHSPWDEH